METNCLEKQFECSSHRSHRSNKRQMCRWQPTNCVGQWNDVATKRCTKINAHKSRAPHSIRLLLLHISMQIHFEILSRSDEIINCKESMFRRRIAQFTRTSTKTMEPMTTTTIAHISSLINFHLTNHLLIEHKKRRRHSHCLSLWRACPWANSACFHTLSPHSFCVEIYLFI